MDLTENFANLTLKPVCVLCKIKKPQLHKNNLCYDCLYDYEIFLAERCIHCYEFFKPCKVTDIVCSRCKNIPRINNL